MKAIITSRKHYVQFTQFTVSTATVNDQVVCRGAEMSTVNAAAECVEGSSIKAVFCEIWLVSGNNTIPGASFVMTIEKAPANIGGPTFSQMTTLDAYSNKKNILYSTQGLVGIANSNPTPLFRQWIKIPKGKQRMGLNDRIRVSIASIGGQDLVGCGLYTFKSYN